MDTPRRLILFAIVMTVVAVVICWSLYLAREVLLLVYISVLFAIGMSPLVRMLEKQRLFPIGTRRFPRWAAILIIYFSVIGAVLLMIAMIAGPLAAQAQELWRRAPELLDGAQQELVTLGVLHQPITRKDMLARMPAVGGDAAGFVLAGIAGVVGGAFGVITIVILTFYLLVDAEPLFENFLQLFPPDRRRLVDHASRQITLKVSAWLGGQLLLGAIIGVSAAVGLFLLGVPYFYVLGFVCGIGELIPIVGPILSAIPAIVVALSVSPNRAVLVALFFLVQQQVESHVLVPKVMSRRVGISAVTVIIALLVGGSLLGLVGALLAVPSAAIAQVVVQELLQGTGAWEGESVGGKKP